MNPILFFTNLRLRKKLLLAFGSLLLLTVILMVIFFNTLERITVYERANEEIDGANIHVLEMEGAVKYFILEGFKQDDFQKTNTNDQLSIFKDRSEKVKNRLLRLEQTDIVKDTLLTKSLKHAIASLDKHVDELTTILRKRGFKDYGVEGQLREAIHAVEKSSYSFDKIAMLTLRRHEKDFFLRRDLKYQNEFNQKAEEFASSIEVSGVNDGKEVILNHIQNYQRLFNEIVTLDREIGLKEKEGIKGKIHHELESIASTSAHLQTQIKIANEQFRSKAMMVLLLAFFIELALGILLAITYSNLITRAIKQLKVAMDQLAAGKFPPKLSVQSNEEIGKTKQAFNQHLERIQAASHFAEELGKGKRDTVYPAELRDDILAVSLIRMQNQLIAAEESQTRINWSNAGIAALNDILKNESEGLHNLSDRVTKFMVTYLRLNQGALFLVQQEDTGTYLNRISTYAYEKKKFVEHKIELNEGLVGQCAMERTTLVLTHVPSDYVKITSGLGEALPRFVILIPLLFRGEIMGVLEMAGFQKLERHEIEFVERVSEYVAAMLQGRKRAAENESLMQRMKAQADQLAVKEEELKQNAEEMQATIEQTEWDKRKMKEELRSLQLRFGHQLSEN